jgi:hypothetical protein
MMRDGTRAHKHPRAPAGDCLLRLDAALMGFCHGGSDGRGVSQSGNSSMRRVKVM